MESRNDRIAGVGGIKISADRTETPQGLGVEVPPGSENTAERPRVQRKHGRSRARLPRREAGRRLDRLNNRLARLARLPLEASEAKQSVAGTGGRDNRDRQSDAREVLASP